ncbi:hypothetical protein [Enterovirga rhinocerotis]|uniref:Uncharacterized protein n=1 Tax=Enterovirga rhinocerotis TaxID=1339210 RepID=A0A4R7BPN8_9HYPH|nr:hypothetical protein [Enterovirga rhinocerotis]TDR87113.1 hypothetical protein EV668_4193 [Enterovirga rhinocerotis]
MHMTLVIFGGIVLLGLFLLFGHLWGAAVGGQSGAAKAFIPVWVVIAAVNFWIGVSHAGYSVRAELPILLLVAAVPVVLAVFAVWQLARL